MQYRMLQRHHAVTVTIAGRPSNRAVFDVQCGQQVTQKAMARMGHRHPAPFFWMVTGLAQAGLMIPPGRFLSGTGRGYTIPDRSTPHASKRAPLGNFTEDELATALASFTSWTQVKRREAICQPGL